MNIYILKHISNLQYISLFVIVLLCLQSCNHYLNVRPQGEVLPKTDKEFAAIMHNRINDIEGGEDFCVFGNMDLISWTEGCSDNLDANITIGNNLESFAGDLINSRQFEYKEFWEIIRDCNIVIENLQSRSNRRSKGCNDSHNGVNDDAIGALRAAYAMKGMCYFNMMRVYCNPWDAQNCGSYLGLPIVEKMDISSKPERSSLKQTFDYTLLMLNKSLELFSNKKDNTYDSISSKNSASGLYFFNKTTIEVYKARLLFWCEQWDDCFNICKNIIETSGYKLTHASEYENMIQSQYEATGEIIAKSHINNASELDWYFTIKKNHLSSRPANLKFIYLFGENPKEDVRFRVAFDEKLCNKKQPEYRIRLSEVYLMAAEAAYMLGKDETALKLINTLRSCRIINNNTTKSDRNCLLKSEGNSILKSEELPPVRIDNKITEDAEGKPITPLLQLIHDERRKELFMEGDRWFELKRNGRPEWWIIRNGLKYTTKKYLYTAPIYKGDVDLNPKMIQNQGYEKK